MESGFLTIAMSRYIKKILLLVLLISLLCFFVFLGINYLKINLASLFSVITAWVTINPLEVDVSAPREIKIGKVFQVKAEVINKGEEKIEEVKGEIFLPAGLVLIRKDSIQEIGTIPAEKEREIRWSVRGEKIGNYFISVKVWAKLKGEEISAEDSVMVKVVKSQPRGKFFERFQAWFRF